MRMRPSHGGTRGFSLVEILVAMVIALLSTIIIFQVFSVSEGIKRSSTSGGDAQQFGAISLFMMERDLRLAGYGINNALLLGCTVRAHNETTGTDFTFVLTPVEIAVGADDKTPDEITVTYGSSDLVATPAKITQNMPSPASVFKVSNRFGYMPGNIVVATEPGQDCTLAQVTDTPGGGLSDNVVHNSGNYTNANGATVPSQYNKPAGLGVSYTTNGSLYNLGAGPIRNTYRIGSSRLVIDSTFSSTTTTALAENIVLLKAQYGKDTTGDGAVDVYNTTAPAAADWAKVLTVRLAIVARGAQPEKPSVEGGPCDTTTSAPTWAGGTLDLSANAGWQCYRYRVFETTVPLRNMLWQQS